MKKWTTNLIATLIPVYFLFTISCAPPVADESSNKINGYEAYSISPSGFNNYGCVDLSSKDSLEVKIWDYYNEEYGLEYTVSTNTEANMFSETSGPESSAATHKTYISKYGYNYLCISPTKFPTGISEYRLVVSIRGRLSVVTVSDSKGACFDIIVRYQNVACVSQNEAPHGLGDVTFYTSSLKGCDSIEIEIDGIGRKMIDNQWSNGAPNCADYAQGVAFWGKLKDGYHSYSVKDCYGGSSFGAFEIDAGDCYLVNVHDNISGSGSGIGNAIFWTPSIPDSGPFNIALDGLGSKTVSGFFSSVPDCSDGSQGGLFENIPVGTYSYTVTDYPAFNGTGSITITEDQCTPVDFTL